MNIFQEIYQFLVREDIRKIEIFIFFIVASFFIGKYIPFLLKKAIQRFLPTQVIDIYERLISTNHQLFIWAGTSILILVSLELISEDKGFYLLLHYIVQIVVIISIALLASGVFRQVIRTYGVTVIRKLGYQADDLLLIFETIINLIIGFLATLIIAQRFDLIDLITRLVIGALGLAFVGQKTLEQFLGTIVIYLDRPFTTGEYIRLRKSDDYQEYIYGRVESIGFRSTKIRSSGKSTLVIVPNSILANIEIENVTRGKKIMVLLYLNFNQMLLDKGEALVRQVVEESMESFFGVEPDSTKVDFEHFDSNGNLITNENYQEDENSQPEYTRARITFFLLGSNQNSLELRKHLLDLANEKVSQQLNNFGMDFEMQEPNIYIEAPVTI